jgi:serine/threonine protein kinase/Tol biopolymer transport system component
MSLSPRSQLGPYEILSPLGAGGMGEVYRATDTRLKRQVAIKILPLELAGDADRLARFQREAEVLASLNHPHIATIYGFEDASGMKALVMELVEGPTLEDRIAKGRIPIDEALPIARQIAEALEAAHDQGIVHRDLKPANVKLREDGTVKVLDFGLAKGRDGSSESSGMDLTINVANSPTIASPALSRAGVILGTAAYMSPEQARGRAVDKRTDVWAFGAVLYEMLSGVRAFDGEDVTELMAAVVKSTPNWAALPADVPPQIVTLIQRCLDKDRKTRIGDIAVARFLLSGDAVLAASSTAVPAVSSAPPRWGRPLAWIAAGIVAGTLAGWLLPRRSTDMPEVTRLQMDVRPAERISESAFGGERPSRVAMTVSPDGRRLVFVGTRGAVSQFYERRLDSADATPIAGTEGGSGPFFSPDGAWIGFIVDNKIKKVAAAGGPAATICDLPPGARWGASWGQDGTVFFAARTGIFKVPSSGGTPARLTTVDTIKGDRHLLPQLLPGGKILLFTAPPDIVTMSLATGEQRTLIEGGSDARYVDAGGAGHLVYMKTGTLMAVPFDLRTAQVTGPSVALVEGIMHGVNAGNAADETQVGQFAIAGSGTLFYVLGGIGPNREDTLTWVDRTGLATPFADATGRSYLNPHLSPDGRKIVTAIRRDGSRDTDLWVVDVANGSSTRLTVDGGGSPVWSPDGKRIVYASGTNSASNLYLIDGGGSGKPERLTTSEFGQTPGSWAAGTNTIAFLQRPTPDTFGIYALPMDGPDAGKPKLFLESRFALTYPELSPDGRWMAYGSVESGTNEVYVQPYPGPGGKVGISTARGTEPVWTANGRELLFRGGTATGMPVFSVTIASLSPFQANAPRALFETKNGEYDRTGPIRGWDVSADGRRLLMLRTNLTANKPVTTIHVVLNWIDELNRRVPAK